MVKLRDFWKDVKKTCNENDSCEKCKYLDFNQEVCAFKNVTSEEIECIEAMLREGCVNEY